jgi:hypothetical protein
MSRSTLQKMQKKRSVASTRWLAQQIEEDDMNELRIPHILWIGLFWSILMMFVAENFIP